MRQLLAVLGSELLCKWHISNFKSDVSRPITGFQYFGNFQKNQKNTKIQQNLKNVHNDLLSFLYRHEVISSEISVRWGIYFHYFVNFQKNQKNTKIHQNFKNVKSDLLSFIHRYEVIWSEIRVRWTSYWQYWILNPFVKRISSTLKVLYLSQ